ncbi:MAG: pyridoxal phosphate-dependent aminotransferase, partial [Chitinophagales bacterium]
LMPKISQKGQVIPASPIRKLVPFADKAKSMGKKVYHLNIGQPDIKTPEVMLDAIRNYSEEVIAYTHSEGPLSYREKLVTYYERVGIDVTPSEIVVTNGGSEAILFGMLATLDAGDEVIIPEPCYANYNGFAAMGDIVVKPITSFIEDSFALPPIEAFRKAITPKTRAILICNPSNPTGYLYSKEELETLKQIVIDNDLFLFVDEVYREFVYDGEIHHSILNVEGLEDHAVVMDSISKRYSACGARLGCLVSRNKTLIKTVLKFAQARLSPSILSITAAEACLDIPDSYMSDVIEEYIGRRDMLIEGLNRIEGVVCPNPKGAFYAFAQLPVENAEAFCQWMLEDFDHEGKTLMMAPGAGFYATPNTGTNQVRLAYVLNKEDLASALDCLEAGLAAYPHRTVEQEMAV